MGREGDEMEESVLPAVVRLFLVGREKKNTSLSLKTPGAIHSETVDSSHPQCTPNIC